GGLMRGRRPTPTAIAVLNGNPGRRPLNANEPSAPVVLKVPRPPAFIDGDPDGRKEWRRTVQHLIDARVLTVLDLPALGRRAYWEMLFRQLSMKVRAENATIPGKQGGEYMNPDLATLSMVEGILSKFDAEFGLTPSSRSRVRAVVPAQQDMFDRFMAGEEIDV